MLNAIGYAIVMEGPGSEYRIAASPFWTTMSSLRSNANPELAATTFYLSAAGLVIIAIVAVVALMRSFEARSVRS